MCVTHQDIRQEALTLRYADENFEQRSANRWRTDGNPGKRKKQWNTKVKIHENKHNKSFATTSLSSSHNGYTWRKGEEQQECLLPNLLLSPCTIAPRLQADEATSITNSPTEQQDGKNIWEESYESEALGGETLSSSTVLLPNAMRTRGNCSRRAGLSAAYFAIAPCINADIGSRDASTGPEMIGMVIPTAPLMGIWDPANS